MPPRHHVDHDPPILDALDSLVPRINPELFSNVLFNCDLTALTNPTRHVLGPRIRVCAVSMYCDHQYVKGWEYGQRIEPRDSAATPALNHPGDGHRSPLA